MEKPGLQAQSATLIPMRFQSNSKRTGPPSYVTEWDLRRARWGGKNKSPPITQLQEGRFKSPLEIKNKPWHRPGGPGALPERNVDKNGNLLKKAACSFQTPHRFPGSNSRYPIRWHGVCVCVWRTVVGKNGSCSRSAGEGKMAGRQGLLQLFPNSLAHL